MRSMSKHAALISPESRPHDEVSSPRSSGEKIKVRGHLFPRSSLPLAGQFGRVTLRNMRSADTIDGPDTHCVIGLIASLVCQSADQARIIDRPETDSPDEKVSMLNS